MADSLPSSLVTVPPLHNAEASTDHSLRDLGPNSSLAPGKRLGGGLDAQSISNLRNFFELLDEWERESALIDPPKPTAHTGCTDI